MRRFDNRGKLSPRYIRLFEILCTIVKEAYKLVFILSRVVRRLRSSEIIMVKVQFRHHPIEEDTKEIKSEKQF